MNNLTKFLLVLAVAFGLALSLSSTVHASENNNTFRYRVNDTVYECNFGGYTGKIVAVLNYSGCAFDVSEHYNEFANVTYFTFYYLKDANTVAAITPTVLRQFSFDENNVSTLVNDYVASGETVSLSVSVGYGISANGALYPFFENSDIEILKVNLKDLKATYNENGVLSSYSTTTHNLANNLLSYFKNGTFTDVGDNYIFKTYSSVKNLTPFEYYKQPSFVTNASFSLNNFAFDKESGVVSWDGFTYDNDALAKGVNIYISRPSYSVYYRYDKVFDAAAEIDVNLGSLYFYVNNARVYPYNLYFQPYYVSAEGKLYMGTVTELNVSGTTAHYDVSDKVFATGKRKENIGVAPSKGDIDAGLGDLYGSGLIISVDELEYSKLCSDFTFCEPYATYENGGMVYLDDLYLTSFNADTEINAVWTGIKYPNYLQTQFDAIIDKSVQLKYARVIVKCEYSAKSSPDLVAFSAYAPIYVDVNDKRLSIDVDKLQPTNDTYYLSRVYFTPLVATTTGTLGMSMSVEPTNLFYGRSSVVKFDYIDSSKNEVIADYGNILDGTHNSIYDDTGYDDEHYEENKEMYDFFINQGNAVAENTTNIANGLNIDGFWSTLQSLGNSLASFPQFVSNMFSFMPLWVTVALGTIIGVVIFLRFLGR